MTIPRQKHRALLLRVAREAMKERGLEPDFPPAAMSEVNAMTEPSTALPGARDLRSLLWCSIDNDDSRDLDQLTVAERIEGGRVRFMVAIADVSATVRPGSAVDDHAQTNTTSVYTPPQNFPMLPMRLSYDLTSLNPHQDRLAIVVSMVMAGDGDGTIESTEVYQAQVNNHAQLAYPGVGAWLEQQGDMPAALAAVEGLADNLKLQDDVAQRLKQHRHEQGALELETVDVHAVMDDDTVQSLSAEPRNRARELIEDFMIAANGSIARFLESHRLPVVRRMLRSPERWQRIVELAQDHGAELPGAPDAKALNEFLVDQRAADPLRFPDLSLSIIKLLGRGEYGVSFPGQDVTGHFGLAVTEYTHSTAPNRRYPDLITQRLLKAAFAGEKLPYSSDQLVALAAHCTQKEDDAQKVERLLRKAAAAVLLSDQIGREFDGIVTGASAKGTWVRIPDPPVEGRVEQGEQGLDVGDRVRVKLLHTNPERGFIDFAAVGHTPVGQTRAGTRGH